MSRVHRPALLLAASLLLAACARGGAGAAKPNTSVAPAAMSDANVAAVVLAANDADVSYARIALAVSEHPGVRAFAQTMIDDHTSVNRAATELAGRLGLVPEQNEASLDLRDGAEETRDELRALSGARFDSAYVANEIAYHRKLLAAIDGALLPSARNAELKALVQSVRPAVVAHLGHAEGLQKSLKP